MRPLLAQTRVELAVTLRNGESLLVTLGVPVGALVFFSLVDVLPVARDAGPGAERVDFLAPGALALAMLATAFANLAIATGFDRSYGVLKRLGSTPLGRGRLVAAKTLATAALLGIQAAVLVPVALALGWRPDVEAGPLLVAVALGVVGFCALALLVAGRLTAMVTLAVANAVFVSLLVLSGMVIPLDRLPGAVRGASRALPSTALTEALHGSLDRHGSVPVWVWPVLALWAAGAAVLAVRSFRWDPDH